MESRSRLRIRAEGIGDLSGYLEIPSFFETRFMFDLVEKPEGYALVKRVLDAPLRKDYDAVESPLRWPELFDVSNWVQIHAFHGEHKVGSAIGAMNTPGVAMLEGRRDLVVLWDLRVRPDARGSGVGAALFQAIEHWGRTRACVELKVETQNVNLAACRLYRGQGCSLAQAHRGAYPDLPGEIQLIWRKRLA